MNSDNDFGDVSTPNMGMPGKISALDYLLNEYVDNGEITGRLVSQLENAMKPAVYHLDKGSIVQAEKFVDKFLFT